MPSAGLIEMPPVSKVTPFPTSASTGACRRAGRIVAEHDHARRLAAAARDAEEQAHAKRCDALLVQHLDRQRRALGGGARALGEDRRRQQVRRLVAEIAREVGARAEDCAAFDRLGRIGARPRRQLGRDQPNVGDARPIRAARSCGGRCRAARARCLPWRPASAAPPWRRVPDVPAARNSTATRATRRCRAASTPAAATRRAISAS